ncbi:uncharacterized protein LOC132561140 [Ylistrum balloti]|uniref:uncharacterized protein LOC132561140 n=1 Tax=Ylistrum balloti TaxID=509963 RepID=UPI002905A5D2|nr:uncharacterized protein LOC132561140 [Ylistrum balloti]
MDGKCRSIVFGMALLCCFDMMIAVNPGFQTRITTAGLNYANQEAIEQLSKSVRGRKLNPIHGKSYSISNVEITEFSPPSPSSLKPIPGSGLEWSAEDIELGMHADFKYSFIIKDHGSFDVSVSHVSFSVQAILGADANGRPTIRAGTCNCNVGSASIRFHGHHAKVYNLIRRIVEGKIKRALKDKLCDVISKSINTDAEKSLSLLKVVMDIGQLFQLDYKLTGPPKFTSDYLETYHKGEIDWKAAPVPPPFNAPPIPQLDDTSRMMYVWVSDYLMNSLLYQTQKHNILSYNLTAKDLPEKDRGLLNTTCTSSLCIGNFIPPLQEKYPNCQIELQMRSKKMPEISVVNGAIETNMVGTIALYARPVLSTLYFKPENVGHESRIRTSGGYILTMDVKMSLTGQMSVADHVMHYKVTNMTISVSLQNSTIANVTERALNILMKYVVERFIQPNIDELGKIGIRLPFGKKISLKNSKLVLLEHALLIATDVVYHPDGEFLDHNMASTANTVFIVVVICHLSTASVNPGFKTRITSEGLTYANSVALDILSKAIIGVSIPDQSGTVSIVTYHLTGIHINGFTRPSSQISLKPPSGLTWTGSNAGLQMHGNWAYHTPIISDSGTFDVSVSGLSFHANVDIGTDSKGRPHIHASGCGVSIGSVSLTFHGGASWLYNLFSSEVADAIKSSLQGKVCGVVTDLINTDGENALAKLPVTVDIVNTFLLDYSMDEQPLFQTNFMESYHKGEIDWKASPAPPPFQASPLPQWNDTSRMMYLWVSDYIVNSLLYQAQQHKFLAYNLTAQDLPPANRSALNTTCHTILCIGNLIPQLQKSYPNCQVELHMRSTSMPGVSVTSTDVRGNAGGIIDFFARPVAGTYRGNRLLYKYSIKSTPAYLFTLNVTMSTSADVQVKNETIYGKLRDVKFGVKVVKTAIKDIDEKALQFIIDIALDTVVIPEINSIGSKGLTLPTIENVHFVNPKLVLMQRTVLVSTDLHYAP